jgi:hypothetical protein
MFKGFNILYYNSFFEKNKKNEKNRLHFADYGVTYIDTSVKKGKIAKRRGAPCRRGIASRRRLCLRC